MTNHPHDVVALSVVRYLGRGALLALAGVVFLVYRSIESASQIDPSTVALVSGVSTLAGAAFGALGAILASTGRGAPQEVNVVNPPTEPIPVEPAADDNELGEASLLVVVVVVLLVLLLILL